jgi:phosphoenolpyruvate-protein kinase (PTS system EI component)
MVPQSIPGVKNLIRSLRLEDSISLCNEVLNLKTAVAVEALVKQKVADWKLNANFNC